MQATSRLRFPRKKYVVALRHRITGKQRQNERKLCWPELRSSRASRATYSGTGRRTTSNRAVRWRCPSNSLRTPFNARIAASYLRHTSLGLRQVRPNPNRRAYDSAATDFFFRSRRCLFPLLKVCLSPSYPHNPPRPEGQVTILVYVFSPQRVSKVALSVMAFLFLKRRHTFSFLLK